jgi:nucleoside phosphorylase
VEGGSNGVGQFCEQTNKEPYQVTTDHTTLTGLKSLLDTPNLISLLEKGFKGGKRPSSQQTPEPGIFTSGSAVIANEEILKDVETVHRKVSALDMEVFSIHRAAELATNKPPCVCAKTVVDLCGIGKDDQLHAYGSYISAQFMIKAISNFFSNREK